MHWPTQKQTALLSISLGFLPVGLIYLYGWLFGDCLSDSITFPASFNTYVIYSIVILYVLGFITCIGMLIEAFVHKLSGKLPIGTLLVFIFGTLFIIIALATSTTPRSFVPNAVIRANLTALQNDLSTNKSANTSLKNTKSCAEPVSIFSERYISDYIQRAEKISRNPATCIAESDTWAVAVPLYDSKKDGLLCRVSQTDATQWCVDSTGQMGDINGALTSAKCPTLKVTER